MTTLIALELLVFQIQLFFIKCAILYIHFVLVNRLFVITYLAGISGQGIFFFYFFLIAKRSSRSWTGCLVQRFRKSRGQWILRLSRQLKWKGEDISFSWMNKQCWCLGKCFSLHCLSTPHQKILFESDITRFRLLCLICLHN